MPRIEPGLRVYAEYLSEITPVDYETDCPEDGWRLADLDLDSRANSVVRITPALLARAQERLELLPLDVVEDLADHDDDDMLVELALRYALDFLFITCKLMDVCKVLRGLYGPTKHRSRQPSPATHQHRPLL